MQKEIEFLMETNNKLHEQREIKSIQEMLK